MAAPVVIIGAGINGLVSAFYLARAGVTVHVLERRAEVGGCVVTDRSVDGFSVPTLAHTVGPLNPQVLRDMHLEHELRPIGPPARLTVIGADGALMIDDEVRATSVGTSLPARDVARLPEFVETARRLATIVRPLVNAAPPSLDSPSWSDLMNLLGTGRRLRGLGRRDAFRLLRWAPMPIADLVDEWFESELLRAAVASRGIFGRAAGPRSAWTSLELFLQAALTDRVIANSYTVAGGPGMLTAALARAATGAGATIRTNAEVARVEVSDGHVTSVSLKSGETVPARAVVSSADPRRTFLDWVDSIWLGPEFVSQVTNFRSRGVLAKVNLALSGLPAFNALKTLGATDTRAALSGRLQIGSSLEALEKAFDASKYGRYSESPYLEVSIPSLVDPELAPSGQHVMSVYVQYAPRELRDTTWSAERNRLGDLVVRTLDDLATGLKSLVVARQVLTPEDLEHDYTLSGGHIFHGEHAIDQLFLLRPIYGWANYTTPIEGLFLCGAGTHPGGGTTGTNGLVASRVIRSRL